MFSEYIISVYIFLLFTIQYVNILTELFNNNLSNQVVNQKVEKNSQLLGNFLKQYGLLMTNIENGKDYLVNVWPTDLSLNDIERDTKYRHTY